MAHNTRKYKFAFQCYLCNTINQADNFWEVKYWQKIVTSIIAYCPCIFAATNYSLIEINFMVKHRRLVADHVLLHSRVLFNYLVCFCGDLYWPIVSKQIWDSSTLKPEVLKSLSSWTWCPESVLTSSSTRQDEQSFSISDFL